MLESTVKNFYSDLVLEHPSNSQDLFKIRNFILNCKALSALPPPPNSSQELAAEFSSSFASKIDKIYAKLEETQSGNNHSEVPKYNSQLEELNPLTQDEVSKVSSTLSLLGFLSYAWIVNLSFQAAKMPDEYKLWGYQLTKILCLDELLPFITRIVNLSFQAAKMPDEYKLAIFIPLLKKIGLQQIFKNYHPTSNLSCVSKLIERGAIIELVEYMTNQNLFVKFQSAYSEGRST